MELRNRILPTEVIAVKSLISARRIVGKTCIILAI